MVAVSAYLPSRREPVDAHLRRYGLSDREIRIYRQYYGYAEIRRDPNAGLAAQLIAAGCGLAELAGQRHRVRYVIQARTLSFAAPYPLNPLHEARDALGLSHAMTFCVSQQACASTMMAMDLAGRLLTEDGDPDALALVFGGEKSFTNEAHVLGVTALMGEGVAAILVRPGDHGPNRVLGFATATHGQFHRAIRLVDEDHEAWTALYPHAINEVVTAALKHAGLTLDDITLILPHHVNRLSWMKVLQTLGVPDSSRLYLANLALLGHCFGADSFINYQSAAADGLLSEGDRYLMVSVGLGGTFSAMVFEH